jgi:hypothetical protein
LQRSRARHLRAKDTQRRPEAHVRQRVPPVLPSPEHVDPRTVLRSLPDHQKSADRRHVKWWRWRAHRTAPRVGRAPPPRRSHPICAIVRDTADRTPLVGCYLLGTWSRHSSS